MLYLQIACAAAFGDLEEPTSQSCAFLPSRHRRSKIPFDTHNDCETLAASVTIHF